MRSYIVDVEVFLHASTKDALKVSLSNTRNGAVWVPKSMVEIEFVGGDVHMLSLPFSMAHDKGLL